MSMLVAVLGGLAFQVPIGRLSDTERDIRGYDGMHEGRKQTNTSSADAGSSLN